MKRFTIVATAVFVVAGTGLAFTDEGGRRFKEFLNGFKEATVVVSTTGTGTFRAVISKDETQIDYVLTFKDLEGDVSQGHIHIGHPQNQGGIVLWLCESDTNPNPDPLAPTPACTMDNPMDARNGKVTGTLTADDVRSQPANGIGIVGGPATSPGEFGEVLALIRAGRTYVNVHSSKFGPGEIRSQINSDRDGHRHD